MRPTTAPVDRGCAERHAIDPRQSIAINRSIDRSMTWPAGRMKKERAAWPAWPVLASRAKTSSCLGLRLSSSSSSSRPEGAKAGQGAKSLILAPRSRSKKERGKEASAPTQQESWIPPPTPTAPHPDRCRSNDSNAPRQLGWAGVDRRIWVDPVRAMRCATHTTRAAARLSNKASEPARE